MTKLAEEANFRGRPELALASGPGKGRLWRDDEVNSSKAAVKS